MNNQEIIHDSINPCEAWILLYTLYSKHVKKWSKNEQENYIL